jgi:glyoxylase-like metal-dependent hydrolase (beta-lactamase superfamily II)
MAMKERFEREWRSNHPGWLPVSTFLDAHETLPDPLFGTILLLPGYEFSSNIYVILGKELTVVDAGNDYTAFVDLFRQGNAPEAIRTIILTHGHRDHAMGVIELLRSYPRIAQNGGLDLVLHEAGPEELKRAAGTLGVRIAEVRGGEILPIGDSGWEVIHTPGHTIDGICLYHPRSRIAFTGDTVLPHAMSEPDEHARGRLDHYLFGVRALLAREIDHVMPGHGFPAVSSGRKVIEETYESLMMKMIGADAEAKIRWIDGATALAQKGCLEEAVYCCDKELSRDPENVRALQLKSVCLNDIGRFHEALESLGRLDGLGSPDKKAIFTSVGKGYALMGLGRYEESVRYFDEALKESPGMADALIYKGMALYLAGNYDAAMEIGPFRKEFVGKFRNELRRKGKGAGGPMRREEPEPRIDGEERFVPKEERGMGGEKESKDVAHYCSEPFVAPGIGEVPPAGGWIAKDAVCRDCMTSSEEISMRRGFVDPVSAKEAREQGILCTRCGNAMAAGS